MKRSLLLLLLLSAALAARARKRPVPRPPARGTKAPVARLAKAAQPKAKAKLEVGFGEADITPKLGKEPVYMAGFGQNRKATKVHDPLFARAVVLRDGKRKIALASVDVVGFFHPNVVNVRKS